MNIPKRVKIGAQSVGIFFKDTALLFNGEPDPKCLGSARAAINCIEIKRVSDEGVVIPESVLADTFLHEIVHLASDCYGLDLCETQVAGLAGALLGVIRDNDLDFRLGGGDMAKAKKKKAVKGVPVAVPKKGKGKKK